MRGHWKRREVLFAAGAAASAMAARAEPPKVKLPDRVRVGLIGLDGHIGEATRVADAYPQVEIVAFESTTPREDAKARNQKSLANARRYSDYRELLDNEELEAVCICDQNWRRAETVTACLKRGLPTAAEKPMGISIAELEEVERVAADTDTPLTMLLPMRFYPAIMAMKGIVDSGGIGEPINLSGQKSYRLGERPEWMKERETFGGSIPYIVCHTVDMLRFVSGRDMVATAAFHGKVGFPETREMENTAAISYQLDNGGTADLRLDYLRPEAASSHGDDRIRIAGERGVLEYMGGRVTLITDTKGLHEITDLPARVDLFADFLNAVFNGSKPILTQEELFRVTRTVLRSREAADSGRVLSV